MALTNRGVVLDLAVDRIPQRILRGRSAGHAPVTLPHAPKVYAGVGFGVNAEGPAARQRISPPEENQPVLPVGRYEAVEYRDQDNADSGGHGGAPLAE